MIIKKQREELLELIKLERLIRRLPPDHFKYEELNKKLIQYKVGQFGEQKLDYYLSHLRHPQIFIFQYLRLPINKDYHFQIDFLLLTPKTMIVIESKHISGEIQLTPLQMLRTIENQTEIFQNPIQQVNNQKYHLINLLEKHSIKIPPVFTNVTFTNAKTVIEVDSNYSYAHKIITRADALIDRINYQLSQVEEPLFTGNELNKITRLLKRQHTPNDQNVLEKYGITQNELLTGIYCKYCERFSVIRSYGWRCSCCNRIDPTSYTDAIQDYYYLINKEITTKESMRFMNLDSYSIALKELKKLNCKSEYDGYKSIFDLRQLVKK